MQTYVPAVALALLTVAACGSDNPAQIDAPPGTVIDANPDTIDGGPADARPDAATATCTPVQGTTVATEVFLPAGSTTRPMLLTSPPGDRRMFVVEQRGTIRVIDQGVVLPDFFIDLRSDNGGPVLDQTSEQGLLGLAFHPDFATNKKFYVFYTRTHQGAGTDDYDNVVAEYQVGANHNIADPGTARIVLAISDFDWNHNGGMIEFSPIDGFLYISTGDGGGGGDPNNNGQRVSQLLGKILRIDVDTRTGTKAYGIPPNNPYVTSADGAADPRPEVWNYGLRNPWRFSFDSNGDLWIGDVGQDAREEVSLQRVATAGNVNFGWDDVEGTICHEASCSMVGKTPPVTDHLNDPWSSVIGGAVYRGTCYPGLVGKYFYTDLGVRDLWSMNADTATGDVDTGVTFNNSPTSIHPDSLGELYVTQLNGSILHIVAN